QVLGIVGWGNQFHLERYQKYSRGEGGEMLVGQFRAAGQALSLKWRRSRGEAVAEHNLRHHGPIRRAAGRGIDCLRRLAEILRTYGGGCDHAKRLCLLRSMVVEAVNRTAGNA